MKNCIDCNKPTNSTQRIRCVECNVVKRKAVAKANKDKYQYHKLPKHRYAVYKRGAEKRGYSFELTVEEFSSLWNKPCHYCNDPIDGIGIDRKDNNIGYTIDNTTSCCTNCNWMKNNTNYNAFILQCSKVANNFLSHLCNK